MEIPILSIIIAIYNAEKTISRCIDSILKQSFSNFEVLLINDGSKDLSGDICEKYADKDKRIRVFHKNNGGVCSARNLGLDNMRGMWFTFVDSDDELTSDALNIKWETLKEDLIILPFFTINLSGKKELIEFSKVKDISNKTSFFYNDINNNSIKYICSKIYRRDTLGNIKFDSNIRFSEDTLFNLTYISKCVTIRPIFHPFYIYYKDDIIFWNKYEHSITESVYSLKILHTAYMNSNLYCPQIAIDIFFNFKRLCQNDINKAPSLWYNNNVVKTVYNTIKHHLGWKQRLHYCIMSIPILFKLKSRVSK